MNRVTLLGTKGGPAVRRGGGMPTSSLVQMDGHAVIIDCGLGCTRSAVAAGLDLRDLSTIFITHLHSDHILELGPMVHTAWVSGRKAPVKIFGPAGLRPYLDGFMASMAHDCAIREADEGRVPFAGLIDFHPLSAGPVHDAPLNAQALEVPHPPMPDCFALRFTGRGSSVTFSGDTAHFPPLAEFARGSDLLVHEAMLGEGVERIIAAVGGGGALRAHLWNAHTEAADVGRIAASAGVARLALNHLIPADDPDVQPSHWQAAIAAQFTGEVIVGFDGLTINL